MSFPAISSEGGLSATNSTSSNINNILFGSCMSQDDVLNLDNRVAADVEASTQELEENRRKKQEQEDASTKESNRKRQER